MGVRAVPETGVAVRDVTDGPVSTPGGELEMDIYLRRGGVREGVPEDERESAVFMIPNCAYRLTVVQSNGRNYVPGDSSVSLRGTNGSGGTGGGGAGNILL